MTADGGLIDAAVHPFVRRADDLREYMPQPWRQRKFPAPPRYQYPAPTGEPPYGEWQQEAKGPDGALPASDPMILRRHLDAIGAKKAILLPLTRGLLVDVDLGNAICAATNDWLADTWLGEWNSDDRFLGSIRINTRDPVKAIDEVNRWADDPRMVQVAVPLESHQPYGQRAFFPLWERIAELDLPVAVRSDGGLGADYYPTPNGYPHQYAEYVTLFPLNSIYHITSLIAEGVFGRLPNLRFVFVDGGHDLLMPLMWRMDMDWAISKAEVPWLRHVPSDALAGHVRFTTSRLEGPRDERIAHDWFARSQGEDLLMYASHYPHWAGPLPSEWGAGVPEQSRRRVLEENAGSFYGLNELMSTR